MTTPRKFRMYRHVGPLTRRDLKSLVFAMVLTVAVRLVYFVHADGPILSPDSHTYLSVADSFLAGDFQVGAGTLSPPLLPLMLLPYKLLGMDLGLYVGLLYSGLAALTTMFAFLFVRRFIAPNAALLAGVAVALNPGFIFWFPYVLTETPYIFFLSAAVYAGSRFVERPTLPLGLGALASLLACGSMRTASLVIVPVGVFVVCYALSGRLTHALRKRARVALIATGVASTLALAATAYSQREALLSHKALSWALAYSAWMDSNATSDYLAVADRINKHDAAYAAQGQSEGEARRELSRQALETIAADPLGYAVAVVRRFAAFWWTALLQKDWSLVHRAFDTVVTWGLLGAALAVALRLSNGGGVHALPWALALALAAVCALTHVETDGRYRLPAELILCLYAPSFYVQLASRLRARRGSGQSAFAFTSEVSVTPKTGESL